MKTTCVGILVALVTIIVVTIPAGARPVMATDCLTPPAGLISWYTGDGNPYDMAGSNHALPHGALAYVPGQVGSAFGFDGTSAYLDVLDSDDLDFDATENFTFVAWMLFPTGSSSPQFILDKRQLIAPGDARGFALYLQGGRIALQLNDGSGSTDFISGGPDLRDGVFHFVAVSVDRTSPTGGTIRIDNLVVLNFDPMVRPGDLSTTSALRIGRYMFESLADYWLSGAIDELDWYSRALTEGEIEALRAALPAGKCQFTYYFGEDINHSDQPPSPPDDPARPDSLPNCRTAQSAFLAEIGPAYGVNSFEDLAPGSTVTEFVFGSSIATVQGELTVRDDPAGTYNGTYPTHGSRHGFQFNNGASFTMTFSEPQSAFAFMGTDIGDGGAHLLLNIHRSDGTTTNVVVPNSTSISGSWPNNSGSALFFGIIDADRPFTAVTFTNPRVSLDGFGFDEIMAVSAVTGLEDGPRLGQHLRQNRPNPFNPRTTITFDLPKPGSVRLVVYDLAGRQVCTLMDGSLPQGSHEAVWDGRDSSGREVGSGSYLATLEFDGTIESVRMGLVR